MKIATYNIHFGGHTNDANHWRTILSEFQPDFICAQESLHPSKYLPAEQFNKYKGCLHRKVHHGKWGSAILSRNHELDEVSLLLPEFEGWVIGAQVHDFPFGGVGKTILLFSIHVPSPGPYEPRVRRLIDAILIRWPNMPMIIAGDFNITTAFRKETESLKNTLGEVEILRKMQGTLGVRNAWQHLHPDDELPQTLRWSNKPLETYHCDGIFISDSLTSHLASAEVVDYGAWKKLSDHNPIVISFD